MIKHTDFILYLRLKNLKVICWVFFLFFKETVIIIACAVSFVLKVGAFNVFIKAEPSTRGVGGGGGQSVGSYRFIDLHNLPYFYVFHVFVSTTVA